MKDNTTTILIVAGALVAAYLITRQQAPQAMPAPAPAAAALPSPKAPQQQPNPVNQIAGTALEVLNNPQVQQWGNQLWQGISGLFGGGSKSVYA